MPTACYEIAKSWPLRRKAAWAALLVAIMGWSSMLQPPTRPEPLPLVGYIVA